RLVWGLFGTPEARFSAFPPDPRAAIRHFGDLAAGRVGGYPSHNPAGALMVYTLWMALAVAIGTGLWTTSAATPMQIAADRAAVAAGDWSALVKEGGDDATAPGAKAPNWVKEVHDMAANLMLILAVLHVAGVAVESRALRRNLVRPMLLGNRNTHTR
ncbi:MAG: cytochrome b/b6 domain-containing protein, partial [Paracoccaceae bacterium]